MIWDDVSIDEVDVFRIKQIGHVDTPNWKEPIRGSLAKERG